MILSLSSRPAASGKPNITCLCVANLSPAQVRAAGKPEKMDFDFPYFPEDEFTNLPMQTQKECSDVSEYSHLFHRVRSHNDAAPGLHFNANHQNPPDD